MLWCLWILSGVLVMLISMHHHHRNIQVIVLIILHLLLLLLLLLISNSLQLIQNKGASFIPLYLQFILLLNQQLCLLPIMDFWTLSVPRWCKSINGNSIFLFWLFIFIIFLNDTFQHFNSLPNPVSLSENQ